MQFERTMNKWSSKRVPPLDLSNVGTYSREMETRCHRIQHSSMKMPHFRSSMNDFLPFDPRDWTRADVWRWLVNLSLSEGLEPSPELAEKFPMNGKALCLMTLDMYLARVPIGGKMLYRDFRMRLAKAMSV